MYLNTFFKILISICAKLMVFKAITSQLTTCQLNTLTNEKI